MREWGSDGIEAAGPPTPGIKCPVCGNETLRFKKSLSTAPITMQEILCTSCHNEWKMEEFVEAMTWRPRRSVLDDEILRPSSDSIFHRPGLLSNPYVSPFPLTTQIMLNEEDRKNLYIVSYTISAIVFSLFLLIISPLGRLFGLSALTIDWQYFGFLKVVILFLISRGVDIATTILMLSAGAGIETNPISDPHDISNLLGHQTTQIFIIVIASYFISLISPYIGHFLLVGFSLLSFRAGLSNLTQPLTQFFLPQSQTEAFTYFYINSFICSVIISFVAFYVFGHFPLLFN